jgi:outer membrane protein OmpA-like peptidoglycan-associated protein
VNAHVSSKLLEEFVSSLIKVMGRLAQNPRDYAVFTIPIFLLVNGGALWWLRRRTPSRTPHKKVRTAIAWRRPVIAFALILLGIVTPVAAKLTYRLAIYAHDYCFLKSCTLKLKSNYGIPVGGKVCLWRVNQQNKPGCGRVTGSDGCVTFEQIPNGVYHCLAIQQTNANEAEVFETTLVLSGGKQDKTLDYQPRKVPIIAYSSSGFKIDKADLNLANRQVLGTIESHIKPVGYWVLVFGHCDAVGSDELNDELGGKRSQSVVDFLMSDKVESDRLFQFSFGKRDPAQPGYIGSNEQNRGFDCIILPEGIGGTNAP